MGKSPLLLVSHYGCASYNLSGGLGFGDHQPPEGRGSNKRSSSRASPSWLPPNAAANVVSGVAAIAAAVLAPGAAMALPAGLEVRGGELTINQPDGTSLIINQGSKRAAGDWSSFDIDNGEQVEVRQPDATSLMLGRVTGGSPTQIQGSLSANGGVILVNPNGMLVGPSAVINTLPTASTRCEPRGLHGWRPDSASALTAKSSRRQDHQPGHHFRVRHRHGGLAGSPDPERWCHSCTLGPVQLAAPGYWT